VYPGWENWLVAQAVSGFAQYCIRRLDSLGLVFFFQPLVLPGPRLTTQLGLWYLANDLQCFSPPESPEQKAAA